MGWVGLGWVEFFLTHHGGLGQKIPSTRPMHTPIRHVCPNSQLAIFIIFPKFFLPIFTTFDLNSQVIIFHHSSWILPYRFVLSNGGFNHFFLYYLCWAYLRDFLSSRNFGALTLANLWNLNWNFLFSRFQLKTRPFSSISLQL